MTEGHTFSLAIPILANIYHSLGMITEASNLIRCMEFCFPMHYVYGWLAHYFNTHYPIPVDIRGPKIVNFSSESGLVYFGEHDARELIHKGASIQWHVNVQSRNKQDRMIGNENLSFNESSYFSSISSQCEATSIIESYSLCCFCKQSKFYQDIPNDIRGIPPVATPKSVI